MDDLELLFISGRFYDLELPKEKIWLLKYFHSISQRLFIVYYLTFNNYSYFTIHTGYFAAKRWLIIVKKKLEKLLEVHKAAKDNFDFELLSKIEAGKYRIQR